MTDVWLTIAVHGKAMTPAAKLARAIDHVGHRADLARPLVVMVHTDMAIGLVRAAPTIPGVAEVVAVSNIPVNDFRFLKAVQP